MKFKLLIVLAFLIPAFGFAQSTQNNGKAAVKDNGNTSLRGSYGNTDLQGSYGNTDIKGSYGNTNLQGSYGNTSNTVSIGGNGSNGNAPTKIIINLTIEMPAAK